MTPIRAAGFALAALLLTSCGGGDSGPPAASGPEEVSPSPTSAPSASAPEADLIVGVRRGYYSPDRMILPAGKASTLLLVNNDPAAHNITILGSRRGRPLFKGPLIGSGERLVYKLPSMKAGRYSVRCELHADMRALAVVR